MSETTSTIHCSFCGIQKSPTTPLIAGNNGHICEACVKLAYQVVDSWGRKKHSSEMALQLKKPKELFQYLDEYVIGQNEAKETLSVAIYNHYIRLLHQSSGSETSLTDGGVELEKSNVIMSGPSGTGKTLLVKTLAKVIGVPFVVADATTLTQAGYVGDDVDSILQRLLESAENDVHKAEWGIVYIDEIDKLARTGTSSVAVRDVSGEGVQQSLLKMVEGSQVKLNKGDKRRGSGEEVLIDTTNILFIVGGAFPGLEKIVSERVQPARRGIGFHAPEPLAKASDEKIQENYKMIQPEDFQEFGLIPEFIGRFPIITFLEELDVEALLRILQGPKNALVKQYCKLFEYQGVKLEFTEAALTKIAQKALDRGTGARGLRGIMESILRKTMFELPSKSGIATCVVDEQAVIDAGEFIVSEILGTNLSSDPEQTYSGHDSEQQLEGADAQTVVHAN